LEPRAIDPNAHVAVTITNRSGHALTLQIAESTFSIHGTGPKLAARVLAHRGLFGKPREHALENGMSAEFTRTEPHRSAFGGICLALTVAGDGLSPTAMLACESRPGEPAAFFLAIDADPQAPAKVAFRPDARNPFMTAASEGDVPACGPNFENGRPRWTGLPSGSFTIEDQGNQQGDGCLSLDLRAEKTRANVRTEICLPVGAWPFEVHDAIAVIAEPKGNDSPALTIEGRSALPPASRWVRLQILDGYPSVLWSEASFEETGDLCVQQSDGCERIVGNLRMIGGQGALHEVRRPRQGVQSTHFVHGYWVHAERCKNQRANVLGSFGSRHVNATVITRSP
jgi:hypothetical protein